MGCNGQAQVLMARSGAAAARSMFSVFGKLIPRPMRSLRYILCVPLLLTLMFTASSSPYSKGVLSSRKVGGGTRCCDGECSC